MSSPEPTGFSTGSGRWQWLWGALKNAATPQTQIFAAIRGLAATGADLNTRHDHDNTLLHHAVSYSENPAVIKALLRAGADVNAGNIDNATPLHVALRLNHNLAVAEALLAAGADVGARNQRGNTPLHQAIRFNKGLAFINALLNAGADVAARNQDGCAPLHLVARFSQDPGAVKTLIAAGADPVVPDKDGLTPLHWAAGNANPAVVGLFINKEADINKTGNDGWTPAHRAGGNSNPAILQALLKAGADVKAQGPDGWTPLHIAAIGNGNPEVVNALLKAGAEVGARSRAGHMPVDLASRYNPNPAVAAVLVASGAATKPLAKQSATLAPSAGLVAQNLSFSYPLPDGGKRAAISNISFALAPGEILTVFAPSFSGKTTLLNILAGRLPPTSGKVTLGNAEITESLARRGLILHADAKEEALLTCLPAASATNAPRLILVDEPRAMPKSADQAKARRLILQLCRDSGKNVALTTNDIEQAMLLGDQLLMMSPCRPAKTYRLSFARQMLDPSLRNIEQRPDFTHLRDKFLNLYADIQKEIPSSYKAMQRPGKAGEWSTA